MGPEMERVAAVFGDRQGSGYLLSARVVLTAAHVVGKAPRAQAIVPGGNGRIKCRVVWAEAECDAALLVADEELLDEAASSLSPVEFGEPTGTLPLANCQAIGFPRAQRYGANRPDSEHFVGTLKPGSEVVRGRYAIDTSHHPPAPVDGGGSPWEGISGAAVFAEGCLIGVVTHDPEAWAHSRLVAVPARKLFSYGLLNVYRFLLDQAPRISVITADPNTEFETRYTDYLTKKHRDLTIFGLDLSHRSRATWPLDSAYLSLEATGRGDLWRESELPGEPPASAQTVLRADEALVGRDRVLLRGVAGSGKTTLVQWLAVSAAQQEPGACLDHLVGRIPFVMPMRTLIRRPELPAPGDFLAATGNPLKGLQPAGWAESVLGSGRGLLLVDGIDEMPERERERTRAWLRDLLLAYPGNLWLITSRPSAVGEGWLDDEGFTELTLSPMTRQEVATFVHRWHNAARAGCPEDDQEERHRLDDFERRLLDALSTKQDLARLATNPLMCGLICALHRDRRAHLPHGRRDLYDAALSMLLARRDQERDVTPGDVELTEEAQIQLLQRLAYWLIRNGQVELERSLAEELLAGALPAMPAVAAQGDAAAVLRYLLVRSGLLRQPTTDTVDFVHRTFQDFLGAKAAVEARDFDLMVRNAHDDQWEDVIRMAVAQARPDERARILRKLIARGDRVKSHRVRLYVLAMACLEGATELDPQVRGEVEKRGEELIPPRSLNEVETLAEAGPILLELLPGPEGLSPETAEAVVLAAIAVGSDAAIPVLARFAQHPDLASLLARFWRVFDAHRYATEVIAHLPQNTRFVAQTFDDLRALRDLGGRPRIRAEGAFTERQLLDVIDGDGLTSLDLAQNPAIGDLGFLRGFPRLNDLQLSDCPSITDLSPLRDIPLEHLGLVRVTLSGLKSLTQLTGLYVFPPLPGELQSVLPRDAHLTRLYFGPAALPPAGLRGLSHWRGLTTLAVHSELAESDWAEIAMLPALTALTVARLPSTELVLPRIERLRILTPHFYRLHYHFPNAQITHVK